MKKIVLNFDEGSTQVTDNNGGYIGVLTSQPDEFIESNDGDLTLQLVKQGVTVDEIIKLKNADLIWMT